MLLTRTNGASAAQGSVFSAGMQAVVAIFGIAWMGDTFISGNIVELKSSIEGVVTETFNFESRPSRINEFEYKSLWSIIFRHRIGHYMLRNKTKRG